MINIAFKIALPWLNYLVFSFLVHLLERSYPTTSHVISGTALCTRHRLIILWQCWQMTWGVPATNLRWVWKHPLHGRDPCKLACVETSCAVLDEERSRIAALTWSMFRNDHFWGLNIWEAIAFQGTVLFLPFITVVVKARLREFKQMDSIMQERLWLDASSREWAMKEHLRKGKK